MKHKPNSFDDALGQLTDDARRQDATRSRRQRADRSLAASLSATFAGSLVELLETQETAAVLMRSGSNVRGTIAAIGPDVLVLLSAGTTRSIIRISAIEGLREGGHGHDRSVQEIADGPSWGELLDEFTHNGERLALTLRSGNRVMGTVERVGLDQVVLRLDGGADALTIPLQAIDQAVVDR